MQDKKLILKTGISLAIGTGVGIGICLLVILLAAFVIVKSQSVPYQAFSVISIVSACIGSFCGGLLTAKLRGSMGLLWGAASGMTIFLILLAVGGILGGGFSGLLFLRLALMLITAALGGVLGVNGKKKKRKSKSFAR